MVHQVGDNNDQWFYNFDHYWKCGFLLSRNAAERFCNNANSIGKVEGMCNNCVTER